MFHIEGFHHVVECPARQRLPGEGDIRVRRDHDDRNVWTEQTEVVQCLRSGSVGKVDVKEDGIGTLGLRECIRVCRGLGEAGVIAKSLDHFGNDLEEPDLIFHNEYHRTHLAKR